MLELTETLVRVATVFFVRPRVAAYIASRSRAFSLAGAMRPNDSKAKQ